MNRNFLVLATAAASTITMGLPFVSLADTPGRHPDYNQVMTNLKMAKAYLTAPDTPNAQADEVNAVNEIGACMHDVAEALVVDGKNLGVTPPPDAGLRGERLQRALELLGKAQNLLLSPEDTVTSMRPKVSAEKHLTQAIDFTRRAIVDDSQKK